MTSLRGGVGKLRWFISLGGSISGKEKLCHLFGRKKVV